MFEKETFGKAGEDLYESKKLQIVKRKITQQLKKVDVQEKIVETTEKLETKRQNERAVWMKVGQRVRIPGSTSVGTIEKIEKNGKVSVNYGSFKTQISGDELERI